MPERAAQVKVILTNRASGSLSDARTCSAGQGNADETRSGSLSDARTCGTR